MELVYGSPEELDVTLVEKLRKEFEVVNIKPNKDGTYKYSQCYVNINSKDIDKEEIETYIGMAEDFDAQEFAAACVEYYGERFWGGGVATLTKEEAAAKLAKLITEPETKD